MIKAPQSPQVARVPLPLPETVITKQAIGCFEKARDIPKNKGEVLTDEENRRVVEAFSSYIEHEKSSSFMFAGEVHWKKNCNTVLVLPSRKADSLPSVLLMLDSDKAAMVGEGGFGQVFEAWVLVQERNGVWRKSADQCNRLVKRQQECALSRTEASVWAGLGDSLGSIVTGATRYMDMSWVTGKPLDSLDIERWADEEKLKLAVAILDRAVAFSVGDLVHCDLKPANIIYDRDTESVVFIDFGLMDVKEKDGRVRKRQFSGTLDYLAPEVCSAGIRSMKSDVFALGVILANLFSEHPKDTNAVRPRHDRRGGIDIKREQIMQQLSKDCPLVCHQAYGLFIEMLAKNPDLRPDVKNCYERLNQIFEYYCRVLSSRKSEKKYLELIRGYKLKIDQLQKGQGSDRTSVADVELVQQETARLRKKSEEVSAQLEKMQQEAQVRDREQKDVGRKIEKLKEQCKGLEKEKAVLHVQLESADKEMLNQEAAKKKIQESYTDLELRHRKLLDRTAVIEKQRQQVLIRAQNLISERDQLQSKLETADLAEGRQKHIPEKMALLSQEKRQLHEQMKRVESEKKELELKTETSNKQWNEAKKTVTDMAGEKSKLKMQLEHLMGQNKALATQSEIFKNQAQKVMHSAEKSFNDRWDVMKSYMHDGETPGLLEQTILTQSVINVQLLVLSVENKMRLLEKSFAYIVSNPVSHGADISPYRSESRASTRPMNLTELQIAHLKLFQEEAAALLKQCLQSDRQTREFAYQWFNHSPVFHLPVGYSLDDASFSFVRKGHELLALTDDCQRYWCDTQALRADLPSHLIKEFTDGRQGNSSESKSLTVFMSQAALSAYNGKAVDHLLAKMGPDSSLQKLQLLEHLFRYVVFDKSAYTREEVDKLTYAASLMWGSLAGESKLRKDIATPTATRVAHASFLQAAYLRLCEKIVENEGVTEALIYRVLDSQLIKFIPGQYVHTLATGDIHVQMRVWSLIEKNYPLLQRCLIERVERGVWKKNFAIEI